MSLIPQPQSVTLKDGVVELASLDDVDEALDTTLLHPEGYTIDISAGLFYARQTLLQLLPPSALRHGGGTTHGHHRRRPWALPAQAIADAPTT
ncbi:hypothetical protein BM221_001257 [Beauveria bassiana]|uniref:Uncharacterized protein n=1 Tax=Beauveria bassiana TaxID=176275 RepID=A0A2N6P2S6_BEABA|nr:hypothetical protein BM221_001257 [Beauveria bassiana]